MKQFSNKVEYINFALIIATPIVLAIWLAIALNTGV